MNNFFFGELAFPTGKKQFQQTGEKNGFG